MGEVGRDPDRLELACSYRPTDSLVILRGLDKDLTVVVHDGGSTAHVKLSAEAQRELVEFVSQKGSY